MVFAKHPRSAAEVGRPAPQVTGGVRKWFGVGATLRRPYFYVNARARNYKFHGRKDELRACKGSFRGCKDQLRARNGQFHGRKDELQACNCPLHGWNCKARACELELHRRAASARACDANALGSVRVSAKRPLHAIFVIASKAKQSLTK